MACSSSSGEFGGMNAEEAFGDERVVELIDAALRGDQRRVRGINGVCNCINAMGENNGTPLLWTLGNRDWDAVSLLLEAGANPNLKVSDGDSAMSIAAGGNSPKLLRILLHNGGDPNLRGERDAPMLNIAALHQRKRNIEVLLEYGADVNGHTEIGEVTAASVAAGQGRMDIAYLLVNSGMTFGLESVATSVRSRRIPTDSEQALWKQKLLSNLAERGIEGKRIQ